MKSNTFLRAAGTCLALACAFVETANAGVPLLANVNDRSQFYDFVLIADSGAQFDTLGDSPSVNRNGLVAFQASNASGQGVWSSDGLTTTDLTPGFDGSSRAFGRAVMLSDAGNAIESDRVSGAPPSTFIRVWPGDGSGGFMTLGRGGTNQPYDSALSHPALSANGSSWAFTALDDGATTRKLVTPAGETQLLGNLGTGYRPMVANDGTVVLRDTDGSSLQISAYTNGNVGAPLVVAGIADGFTTLGNQPGISDSGEIIVFSGDRGNGAGVFLSYVDPVNLRQTIRVVGEGAAVQGNRPELGFDTFENPIFFSGIDFNSRVAVIHQSGGAPGLDGDTVVVAFMGTPSGQSTYPRFGHYPGLFFRNAPGLWTMRLDFHVDDASNLQVRRRYAIPVVQVGDTLSGVGITGFTVAAIGIHDPIAEAATDDLGQPLDFTPGSHRTAFWALNAAGQQVIVRGTHVNSCLLPVRHFSQCDSRWANSPYVTTGDGFCAKACALTSQTMAANHGADFYQINDFRTPAEVHDFIRPRGGFSGNSVNWPRAVQALRQSPGLLSLQPNALRFVGRRISVLPGTSAARKAAATTYIDGAMCEPDNPAPVIVGADREYNMSGIPIPGHFILVSGRANNKRFISDPGYARGILFSQGNADNTISLRYDNNFSTRGVVRDPTNLGGLTITVSGTATLRVTDDAGRQSGFVAGLDEPLENIPGAIFFFDAQRNLETGSMPEDETATFLTDAPSATPYSIEVIGVGNGPFEVQVELITPDGTLTPPATLTDTIAAGEIRQFTVSADAAGASLTPGVAAPDPGDIDGDGDVDSNDLTKLLADRNKTVAESTCGSACDLNADLRIDALDARKLVTLCTRPRCATQ